MSIADAIQNFLSWKGTYIKFDSKRKVYALECYFTDLFNIMRGSDLHEILYYLHKWELEDINNPNKLKRF